MATVIVPSRIVRIASNTAGTAARSKPRPLSDIHHAHGMTTAKGPTYPTGPLQSTAKPISPPMSAARATVSLGEAAALLAIWLCGLVARLLAVWFAARLGSNTSAARIVLQAVSAVRIASGVAAWASMPTKRQPT